MSQKPMILSSTAAITCGNEPSITRLINARVLSTGNPSTVAKYHFSAAMALMASHADSASASRADLICTCCSPDIGSASTFTNIRGTH
jgi:hypothetical protein